MQRLIPGARTGITLLALAVGMLILGPDHLSARQENTRSKAWLGVAVQDVTESVAKKNNIPDEHGAYVSQVTDDSPADSVGIRKGDIIVSFNREDIEDADALLKAVGKLKKGDKADLVVVRKGEKKNFQVFLGRYPRTRQFAVTVPRPGRLGWMLGNHTTQGMQLMELNDQLSEYFGVTGGTGVLVERVGKGTPAEKAGIKAGDVLQKIDKRTIDDLEDVSKAMRRVEDGDKVSVEVLRKGQTKSLTLEAEEEESSPEIRIFRGDASDAGWNQFPHFEENMLHFPGLGDRQLRLELENVAPRMDELKERMHDMQQNLNKRRGDIERAVRMLRVRSV